MKRRDILTYQKGKRKLYARTRVKLIRDTRRVSPEDIEACEIKYNKSKVVHSIVRHVSETTATLPGQLYKVGVILLIYRIYRTNYKSVPCLASV